MGGGVKTENLTINRYTFLLKGVYNVRQNFISLASTTFCAFFLCTLFCSSYVLFNFCFLSSVFSDLSFFPLSPVFICFSLFSDEFCGRLGEVMESEDEVGHWDLGRCLKHQKYLLFEDMSCPQLNFQKLLLISPQKIRFRIETSKYLFFLQNCNFSQSYVLNHSDMHTEKGQVKIIVY